MHIASVILTQFAIFMVHLPLQYQPLKLMLLTSRVIFCRVLNICLTDIRENLLVIVIYLQLQLLLELILCFDNVWYLIRRQKKILGCKTHYFGRVLHHVLWYIYTYRLWDLQAHPPVTATTAAKLQKCKREQNWVTILSHKKLFGLKLSIEKAVCDEITRLVTRDLGSVPRSAQAALASPSPWP